MAYDTLAENALVEEVVRALEAHNFAVIRTKTGQEAREKVLGLIPEGSEVMTMTSVTLDTIGLTEAINQGTKFNPVRTLLNNPDAPKDEKKRRGAAPEYTLGSVHAVTLDGELIVASNTGSQMAAYVYGAGKVIFVVSTKKVVKNREDGFKRIYDYTLPLESERARKAYGVSGSAVNKLLVIREEVEKDRITVVLVDEVLGF